MRSTSTRRIATTPSASGVCAELPAVIAKTIGAIAAGLPQLDRLDLLDAVGRDGEDVDHVGAALAVRASDLRGAVDGRRRPSSRRARSRSQRDGLLVPSL